MSASKALLMDGKEVLEAEGDERLAAKFTLKSDKIRLVKWVEVPKSVNHWNDGTGNIAWSQAIVMPNDTGYNANVRLAIAPPKKGDKALMRGYEALPHAQSASESDPWNITVEEFKLLGDSPVLTLALAYGDDAWVIPLDKDGTKDSRGTVKDTARYAFDKPVRLFGVTFKLSGDVTAVQYEAEEVTAPVDSVKEARRKPVEDKPDDMTGKDKEVTAVIAGRD